MNNVEYIKKQLKEMVGEDKPRLALYCEQEGEGMDEVSLRMYGCAGEYMVYHIVMNLVQSCPALSLDTVKKVVAECEAIPDFRKKEPDSFTTTKE